MKKLFTMAALAAAMLMPITSMAAPSVYFVPDDQSVVGGGSVGVWVDGSTTVGSFDLNIHASNTNLQWTGAAYSSDAPLGASPDDADFSSSISGQDIDVLGFSWLFGPGSLPAVQDGSPFLLFTLDFTVGPNFGPTALSFVSTGGGGGQATLGTNITNWDGEFQRNSTFGTACVRAVANQEEQGEGCPTTVPEPSALGLVSLALLAAGWAGRARRKGAVG